MTKYLFDPAPVFLLAVSGQDARSIYRDGAGLDMARHDLQLPAREQGRPWDSGMNFKRSADCSRLVPVTELGVLGHGAITDRRC